MKAAALAHTSCKALVRGADRFRLSLSIPGLLLATLFFAIALTPSLVPRPFLLQALLCGAGLGVGYAIGVFFGWLWHFLELPEPKGRTRLAIKLPFALFCLVIAISFLIQASTWQNTLRELMAMGPVETTRPLSTGALALLIFLVLLGIARLFRWIKRSIARRLHIVVPPRLALVLGAIATFGLFWLLVTGVLARQLLNSFDASFQQLDSHFEAEQSPPSDPLRTGSAASLIDWDLLGRQGRRFIAATPSTAQLAAVVDGEVRTPVRVYVGLNSAETISERADLALAELVRTGGFERDLLIVAMPTGTGWIDPGAIRSVEYLHRGNVATVAMQYSYLPSWLSLLAQPESGEDTARALFEAVYRHWRQLPPERRPRFFLHGLSLGALNSQRATDVWDIVADPIHGALWSGPPFRSTTWRWATDNRHPDSPAWLPRFRDGSVIRFANQDQGLEAFDADWGPLRIVFLQYASDPITFFEPGSLWREPTWMREPRGPDISPRLRWYPIVTFLQLGADIAAADASPIGYGHVYATEHYIDAWYALTDPEGWTAGGLERLKGGIGDLGGGGEE